MTLRSVFALLCLTLLGLAPVRAGEVSVRLLDGNRIAVDWRGKEVIPSSEPRLSDFGAREMEVYDPTTRQTHKVRISSEEAALRVVNKEGQQVALGTAKRVAARDGDGVVIRETYPNIDARWEMRLAPTADNALDLVLDVSVNENYWLQGFHYDLFRLAVAGGVADSGNLRSRLNKPNRPEYPAAIEGKVEINYPNGPEAYVPAAVFNGTNFAAGVAQLDVHTVWRNDVNRITFAPDAGRTGYAVTLRDGWSDNGSFTNMYKHTFHARYRFRFSDPVPAGAFGYATLVDAKNLWIDYLRELDREMPERKQPPMDPNKNNLVILHYFVAEAQYMTPENPMGYLMNHPGWKDDKWEWNEKINSSMPNDEIKRRTGLGDENFGKPVKWVKPMAERLVREAVETKTQAVIVMRSNQHPQGGELNYIPESHVFHPDFEERMPVAEPVAIWDFAVGVAKFYDPQGTLIGTVPDLAVQAADRDRLIPFNRGNKMRQELFLHESKAAPGFAPYKGKFDLGPQHDHAFKNVGGFMVVSPQQALVGKKPGETATITVHPMSWHGDMRDKPFKLELTVAKVERTAINVWAKTLTDAGVEMGFLIREDITAGPPWLQFDNPMDFTNSIQYQILKQRVEWNRARFGEKCRWFYLDVFGDYTPAHIFARLQADFPDCFFFAEHPNDVADRRINGWKWFGTKTTLEEYVAPHSIVTVIGERFMNYNDDKDREALKRVFNQPGYIVNTHRAARRIVKLMEGK